MLIKHQGRDSVFRRNAEIRVRQPPEVFGQCRGGHRSNRNRTMGELDGTRNGGGKFALPESCEEPVFQRGNSDTSEDRDQL